MSDPKLYCCKMRERFVLGIVLENPKIDIGSDAVDCIDFGDGTGKPTIRIRFCPFCGVAVKGPLRETDIEKLMDGAE